MPFLPPNQQRQSTEGYYSTEGNALTLTSIQTRTLKSLTLYNQLTATAFCGAADSSNSLEVVSGKDGPGFGLSIGWVGSRWVEFFGNYRELGWVGFNDTVMGWIQRLRAF